MTSPAEDPYAEVVRAAWLLVRPSVERRIRTIETAAASAAAGTLNHQLREAAATEAHRLAGSLGSYGFHQAGDLARQIEVLLQDETANTFVLVTATDALATLINNSRQETGENRGGRSSL
jgi:HPt (histidine-containing phosphotransfer) domain-containing protein